MKWYFIPCNVNCPLFRLVWGGPAVHHVWVWWWRLWPRWMQGQNLACLHVVDVQDEQCGPLSCWDFNGPLYSVFLVVFLSLMSLVFLIVSLILIVLRWPCVVDRTLKSNYYYSQSHTSSTLSLALFTCSFSHAIYTYRSKCRRRRNFCFVFIASSHGFFFSFLLLLIFFKNQYWLSFCACGCALDVLLLFWLSDVHLTFTSDTIHFEGIILIVTMLTL